MLERFDEGKAREIPIEEQIKRALMFHRHKMLCIARLIREAAGLLTGESEDADQHIAEVFAVAIKIVFES